MLEKLYTNLVKSPITSLIGAVTCGFTMFDSEVSQVVSATTPLVDSVIVVAKEVQTGWGMSEWMQFLGSMAMMFYAKDK